MTNDRVPILLESLGIDEDSFDDLLEWVLCEKLVRELGQDAEIVGLLGDEAELRRFRDVVERRTKRDWTLNDLRALLDRVKVDRTSTARRPIRSEEALLLRLTAPLRCAECGAEPPDVVLHMDHIIPASRSGGSTRENLQFLCQEDNLRKSNKRQREGQWLELR